MNHKNLHLLLFSIACFSIILVSPRCGRSQDGRQMSFSISATRTVRSSSDVRDTSSSSCPHGYQKDNSTLTLSFNANSSKITFGQFGDDIQSPARPMNTQKDSDLAFTGSGTISYEGTSDHGGTCGGAGCDPKDCCGGKATSSWNVSENINLTGDATFEYDSHKKQGSFNLTCACDPPSGNADGQMNLCDSQYLPSVNADVDKAYLKMVGDVFGVFHIQNYSTFAALRIAQKMKDEMQQALDAGGNGGIATITATAQGYELSYSNTVSSSGTPAGMAGNATSSITTNVHVSIGGQPIEYDAYLVPIGTLPTPGQNSNDGGLYDNWVPEGPTLMNGSPQEKFGNSVIFAVELVDKKNPDVPLVDVPYSVTYTLTSSNEPGIALNYPVSGGGTTDPDLQFSSGLQSQVGGKLVSFDKAKIVSNDSEGANVTAVINSFDYGGYGTLAAKITLRNGGISYDAHLKGKTATTVNIPKDDNNNHIADKWEQDSVIFYHNYAADFADSHSPGNSHNGDGLTLYEKYRGIFANQKHVRLSPVRKDLIVANASGVDLTAGINYFEGSGCGIDIIQVQSDEIDNESRVVNINNSTAHGGDQHGIIVQTETIPSPSGNCQCCAMRASNGDMPNSPGDVTALLINQSALDNPVCKAFVPYAFARWLAACMGVRSHGADNTQTITDISAYKLVNAFGKPITAADMQYPSDLDPPILCVQAGSKASGDVNCIMTENLTPYHFMLNGNTLIYLPNNILDGTTFCTSTEGTGRNSTAGGYVGGFGDATSGNCMSKFHVSDWQQ